MKMSMSLKLPQVQTKCRRLKLFEEAEKFPGPSIIMLYTMYYTWFSRWDESNVERSEDAVHSGYWSLYRYNPLLREKGKRTNDIDFKKPDFH